MRFNDERGERFDGEGGVVSGCLGLGEEVKISSEIQLVKQNVEELVEEEVA